MLLPTIELRRLYPIPFGGSLSAYLAIQAMLLPQIHLRYPYVTTLAESTSSRLPDVQSAHAPKVCDPSPSKVGDVSLLPFGAEFHRHRN